jgi:hypothetical protein
MLWAPVAWVHSRWRLRLLTDEAGESGESPLSQPLNQNGSSSRANWQANKWNKQDGAGTYQAAIAYIKLNIHTVARLVALSD